MRQCPRCGKLFPENRMHCNVTGCSRKTVEVIDWTGEDEKKAMEDLAEGILSDPFNDYEEIKWSDKNEIKASLDLEEGIMEDPFEDYEEPSLTTDEIPLTEKQAKEHDPILKPKPEKKKK